MESTQGRLSIAGIASMALSVIAFSLVATGLVEPNLLMYAVTVLAMALGIVAVIVKGRGQEYGIVGMALGLVTLLALMLDISF